MKVSYSKKFLKQLAQLPSRVRSEGETFVFEQLPNASSIAEVGSIEKMQGYRGFYKARFGSRDLDPHEISAPSVIVMTDGRMAVR